MNKNLITLCIPTFNRQDTVCSLLNNLIQNQLNDFADILVIDDGSSDESFSKMQQFVSEKNIRILKNDTNLGFAGNILRLSVECQTEYIAFCTDDEVVLGSGFKDLFKILEEYSPDFLSTHFISHINTREHRRISEIELVDVWKSSKHFPGLVFKKTAIDKAQEDLHFYLNSKNLSAKFFPQVFLATIIKLSGMKLMRAPVEISQYSKYRPDSGQIDDQNRHYASLSTVIERHNGFSALYNSYLSDPSYSSFHADLKRLIKNHNNAFYKMVESGIGFDDPKLLAIFRWGLLSRILSFRIARRVILNRVLTLFKYCKHAIDNFFK
jgi:glycosyltransferase involved in cell wall biosynthesis